MKRWSAIEAVIGKIRWFHITRSLGVTTVLYELFFAQGTAERGTIILAGLGICGFDFVTRAEKRKES